MRSTVAEAALAAGGTEADGPEDHGFMSSRSLFDLDGHGWQVMWMDPAAAQQGPGESAAATQENARRPSLTWCCALRLGTENTAARTGTPWQSAAVPVMPEPAASGTAPASLRSLPRQYARTGACPSAFRVTSR